MPTTFIKANRKYKQANGEYSDPISYSTSSESVEMTDGTDLQTKMNAVDTKVAIVDKFKKNNTKNQFVSKLISFQNYHGINIASYDGDFEVWGTATEDVDIIIGTAEFYGGVTLSGCPNGGSLNGFYLYAYDAVDVNGHYTSMGELVGDPVIDTGSGCASFNYDRSFETYIILHVSSGTEVDDEYFKPMVRISTDDSTYVQGSVDKENIFFPVNYTYNSANHTYTINWESTYKMLADGNGSSPNLINNVHMYIFNNNDPDFIGYATLKMPVDPSNGWIGYYFGSNSFTKIDNNSAHKMRYSNSTVTIHKLVDTSAIGTAASKDVPTSGNASATQVVMGNDSRLSDSRPASDVSAWAKESTKPTYTASEVGAIATTAKGSNNGVAELDANGKVPSAQLPSYVDDVIEGYYNSSTDRFYKESTFTTVIPPESGKSWVDIPSNKSYRWTGSVYTRVDEGVQLGETSSTAYRGDRGKIAYDHSQLTNGNPHNVSKSDVGLGNVGNFKAVSTEASQGLTDTEKSNARTNIGAGTSNFSGSYNDLSDKPDLDAKLDKAGGTMTGSIVTTTGTAMKPQTNNTGNVGSSGYRYAAGYYNFVDLKGSNTNGSFAAVLRGAEDTGTIEFAKEADSNNDYRQVFQNKDGTLALTSDIEVSEEDIASTQTVSGNPITVTDAAPINAEDITVDITPKQDLHGYDRPWAGGAWKNKLPMTVAGIKAANTVGTWSGNTWTYNNNSFTILTDSGNNVIGIRVNGSFSANVNFRLTPTGDLGLNGLTLSGASGGVSVLAFDDTQSAGSSSVIPNNFHNYRIFLSSGTGAKDVTIYPMVSAEGGAFAPYSNICPIEGRTGAKLDRVGKNWMKQNNGIASGSLHNVVFTLNDNKSWTINGLANANTSWWLWTNVDSSVLPAGNYIVSRGEISNKVQLYIDAYKNGTFARQLTNMLGISEYRLSLDWTEYDKLVFGLWVYNGVNVQNETVSPMIRLASITDSTYEPYQGISRTVNFGETVYGGKWHVTEGGTDNDRVYVVARSNNTDEGYVLSNNIVRLRIPNVGNLKTSADSAICSHLTYEEHWDGGYQHFYCSTAGNIFIYVPGSTIQEAKDYLEAQYNAGIPIEICATKKTPTTISTPKQNVPMLQGINTVYADCGDTQLKYQPDNVIGELKSDIINVGSVDWSNITNKPSSFTPASHTHGNIQNDGSLQTTDITIASGDKLVITDSSDSSKIARASISFDGSTATKCLTQKGTWATFASTDTLNTVGATNNNNKLYLIGTMTQGLNPISYAQGGCYAEGGKLYSNSKEVVTLSDSQALTGKTYNGYTLGAACEKGVATEIRDGLKGLVASQTVYSYLNSNYKKVVWTSSPTVDQLKTAFAGLFIITNGTSLNSSLFVQPGTGTQGVIDVNGSFFYVGMSWNATNGTLTYHGSYITPSLVKCLLFF